MSGSNCQAVHEADWVLGVSWQPQLWMRPCLWSMNKTADANQLMQSVLCLCLVRVLLLEKLVMKFVKIIVLNANHEARERNPISDQFMRILPWQPSNASAQKEQKIDLCELRYRPGPLKLKCHPLKDSANYNLIRKISFCVIRLCCLGSATNSPS